MKKKKKLITTTTTKHRPEKIYWRADAINFYLKKERFTNEIKKRILCEKWLGFFFNV